MGEPAYQLPEEDKPDIRPHLRGLEGGGETTERKRDHLHEAEEKAAGGGANTTARGGSAGAGGVQSKSETKEIQARQRQLIKGLKKTLWSSRKRKAGTVGGIFMGTGGAVIAFLLSFAGGPYEMAQLAHILEVPGAGNNAASSDRTGHLLAYARAYKAGNVGETRLSWIGSKTFNRTMTQLSDIGIDFQFDPLTGAPKTMTVDATKLAEVHPELKGASVTEQKAFLKTLYGSDFSRIGSGVDAAGNKYAVNTRDFGIKATRTLGKSSLASLDDGKIVTALKFRDYAKFTDSPNAFHPIQKAQAAGQKKAITALERKQEASDRQKKARQYTDAKAEAASEGVKSSELASKSKVAAGSILLVTGIMCAVRDSADAIQQFNTDAIVAPAVAGAVDKIAVGEQAQSGDDTTIEQQGGEAATLYDSDGKSVFGAQAIQVLSSEAATGPDLPNAYQQAFSNKTTAANIKNELGGGGFGDVACSGPGKALQLGAGLALLISGFVDGGTSWAAKGALAAGEGAKYVATAGTFALVEHLIQNVLEDKAVVPDVLSGPLGGNLLAYGARSAANINAVSTGGVALSGTESTAVTKQAATAAIAQFKSRPLMDRIFDLTDYHSLFGSILFRWQAGGGIRQFSASSVLGYAGSLPGSLSGILTPHTDAAAAYHWGFALYGEPKALMDDPHLADPYANGDTVGQLLSGDTGQDYIDRANTCFGVNIAQGDHGWEVRPDHIVDMKSDEYSGAACGDFGDANWKRVAMFVFDSRTADAADCYDGDQESCDLVTGTTSNSANGAGSKFNIASINVQGAGHRGDVPGRSNTTIGIITSNDINITGFQEMTGTQRDYFSKHLSGFDYFPKDSKVQNPVAWDTSKFTVVPDQSGLMPDLKYFGSTVLKAPYVLLKDNTTGQEFYVLNTHDPANAFGCNCGANRDYDARQHAQFVSQLKSKGLPVFFTGDFNSKYTLASTGNKPGSGKREDMPYCVLTDNDLMIDAYDSFKGRSGHCPTTDFKPPQGDHVFMTDEAKVSDFKVIPNPGADHHVIFAAVTIDGSGNDQSLSSTTYKNPVIDAQSAGESVIRASDGTFHLYATGSGKIQHWTSDDAIKWSRKTSLKIKGAPKAASGTMWKPSIAKVGDTYVMTWAGTASGVHGFAIYYGTSSSAGGPFAYGGKLVAASSSHNNIDPMIFQDGSQYYLYYTSGATAGIKGVKLSVNGNKIGTVGATKTLITYDKSANGRDTWTIEAPYVIKRNGYYYMLYSTGNYVVRSDYRVVATRSTSPLGNFTRKPGNPVILGNDKAWVGVGTPTMFTDDAGVDWMLYTGRRPQGSMDRLTLLDKVTYSGGWPVVNDGNNASSTTMGGPSLFTPGSGPTGSGYLGAQGFPGGNCVDYVKYILNRHSSKYHGGSLGNGKDVAGNLGKLGYTVNHTPAVHATASFPTSMANPTYGHVAIVSEIKSDGSIVVEEANWSHSNAYGKHTVKAADVGRLTYAHTEVGWH